MTRATSSPRKRIALLSAAAAAAAALVASRAPGATADIVARPPFFVPQRADNLILSGGRDAGDWESLHALADAGLPCYGNMCETKSAASSGSSAMDNNPGAVQKNAASRNVDQSYVGHSQPIGSSVEGGAFDSRGRLADPAATLSAVSNPAARGGGGSMFAGAGSEAAREVASSFANASGVGGAKLAWDPANAAAATATAAPAATTTATAAAAAAAPASSSPPTTASASSSTMETLAAVERAPTTAFPTAGKKATTPAGGVAFASGEHEYIRAEKAIDESLDEALDGAKSGGPSSDLRLPPAPRGPAGKAAAALVGAARGAAERVAGAASSGVSAEEGQPPADDAEAFSMAVANAAGKVAKRLGEVAAAGAGGGRA